MKVLGTRAIVDWEKGLLCVAVVFCQVEEVCGHSTPETESELALGLLRLVIVTVHVQELSVMDSVLAKHKDLSTLPLKKPMETCTLDDLLLSRSHFNKTLPLYWPYDLTLTSYWIYRLPEITKGMEKLHFYKEPRVISDYPPLSKYKSQSPCTDYCDPL